MARRDAHKQADLLEGTVTLSRFGTKKERPKIPFQGTDSPRKLRILQRLFKSPVTREEVDIIAGASNGPDEILQLRELGLELPCYRLKVFDRDGEQVCRGLYGTTPRDRREILRFFASMNDARNRRQAETGTTKGKKESCDEPR